MSSGETPSSFFVSHKLEEPCVYKMKKKKEKQKYTCNMKEESESKIDYSTNHNMQNMMQRFFFLKRKKLKNKTEFNDNMIKEDKLEEKINEDFVITEEGEKKSNKKIKNNTQHNDNNNNNDVFICNSLYELLLNKEKSFFLNIKHGKLKYINERMHTSELTYIDIVTTNNILICISFNSVDYPLEINPHINIRYMPYLNNDIQYYYPLIDLNKPKIPEQDHKNVIPGIIGFSNSPSYVGFNPVHAESGMFGHSSPGLTFGMYNNLYI